MAQRRGDFTGGFKVELVGQRVGEDLRQGFRLTGAVQAGNHEALGKNGVYSGRTLDHVIQNDGHAVTFELHAGSQVVHLVRAVVAQRNSYFRRAGKVHARMDNVLARQ